MPYDKRGYFYYGYRVKNRIRRLYFGRGPLADLASFLVERIRQEQSIRKRRSRQQNQVDRQIELSEEEINLSIQATLLSIGYHRNDRGPWRKWREPRAKNPDDSQPGHSSPDGGSEGPN